MSSFQRFIYTFGFFFLSAICLSQESSRILLELKSEVNTNKPNLIDVLVAVNNTTDQSFNGLLSLELPKGIRSISENTTKIQLKPNEKQFVPIKLWMQTEAQAGNAEIVFNLFNNEKQKIASQKLEQFIKENNQLKLAVETPLIYLTNPNDSIRIKTHIANLGNKSQTVTLVYKIPELIGENNFFELKGKVDVKSDSTFIFTFLPTKRLLKLQQFNVQITGLRGESKELFGNTSVQIQNINSTQQFIYSETDVWNNLAQKNTVTTSYRQIGKDNYTYQLQGNTTFDLPAGFLSLQGIFYKNNADNQAILNNTTLAYTLYENQLSIGNLSKPFEMSLFGRGISVETASKTKDKSLEVGFIDQQFNLIQKDAFLQNGYGIYARGTLDTIGKFKNIVGHYVFKQDPHEKADHHVFGTEFTREINYNWRINSKLHAGLSNYDLNNLNKTSYAAEVQYNGTIKAFRLFGNYFLSSNYFPGNRRGILQIQQNISTDVGNGNTLSANYFYSDFAPKSVLYPMNTESNNTRAEIGIRWKKRTAFGAALYYQFQNESSTNFNGIFESNATLIPSIKAHRFIENINWTSKNEKHLLNLDIENGFAQYPFKKSLNFQGKTQLSYSFQKLYSSISYQKGSYYLSEYFSMRNLNSDKDFFRMLFSVAYQDSFFQQKLQVNSGFSYIEDSLIDEAPSLFLNLNFNLNDDYQFYLNSSWLHYKSNPLQNTLSNHNKMITIEGGIRFNFNKKTPSAGKKSRIKARVFYDQNANNIFDEGDTIAPNYFTILNNRSFLTDEKGELVYKSVPFGSYKVQPKVQEGWYPSTTQYEVNNYRINVDIPLHRNGTLMGKIVYDFDEKRVAVFDPKLDGIVFYIMQNDKQIQKINTNSDGKFTVFLPNGEYQIMLNEKSLPDNTFCDNVFVSVKIESGKVVRISPFKIQVKQKKVNIKHFGD